MDSGLGALGCWPGPAKEKVAILGCLLAGSPKGYRGFWSLTLYPWDFKVSFATFLSLCYPSGVKWVGDEALVSFAMRFT